MSLEGGVCGFVWFQFLACFFFPHCWLEEIGSWLNCVITFKIEIYKSYAFQNLSSSRKKAVTELWRLFIYLFDFFLILVLSREMSPLAFLLILPELTCFAGKEYVCVPDPTPECIPLATKKRKNRRKKMHQSCTGKELKSIKRNLPRSCVTLTPTMCCPLQGQFVPCLMAPWAAPNARSWVSTHI